MEDLKDEYGDRILLGAGTITVPEQAERSVSAGAAFLVSPGCDPELVPLMQQTGLAVLPGTLTPSEVMLAQRLGLEVVKLFPGSVGGLSYLKSLLEPFPEMGFLPTGGIALKDFGDWFAAGAFAAGVGGELAPAELRGRRKRDEVIDRAKRHVDATRAARVGPNGSS